MAAFLLGERMLTAQRLRELLEYSPETGEFKWRKPPRNKDIPGLVAGSQTGRYVMIGIARVLYYGHRLAWLYVHGEWPARDLDHINRDCRDNRIANLRLATDSENLCNKPVRRDSRTGLKGVAPKRKKYAARITKEGRIHFLGSYDTPEDAHAAYCRAARELHGDFAHI